MEAPVGSAFNERPQPVMRRAHLRRLRVALLSASLLAAVCGLAAYAPGSRVGAVVPMPSNIEAVAWLSTDDPTPSGSTVPSPSAIPDPAPLPTPTQSPKPVQTAMPSAGISDIAALSPKAASLMAQAGRPVSASVVLLDTGEAWGRDIGSRFPMASTAKVAIAMAMMDRVEHGARWTAYDRLQMLNMLEYSNSQAGEYFYERLGMARGLSSYLAKIGVTGWQRAAGCDCWGYSTVTAATQARLL